MKEAEALTDDIEVLLGQIGFEQLAIAGVEKLNGDGVLSADGRAGVVDHDALVVVVGLCVLKSGEFYRDQKTVFFGNERPGIFRIAEGHLGKKHVGRGVEVGEQDGVGITVYLVLLPLAIGGDVELELASGGVRGSAEADGLAVYDATEQVGDEVQRGVELLRVGKGVAELAEHHFATGGDDVRLWSVLDGVAGTAETFAVLLDFVAGTAGCECLRECHGCKDCGAEKEFRESHPA